MEWISVEDRLPEVAQDILFVGSQIDVKIGGYFPNHMRNYPWEQSEPSDRFQLHEVTHWMPLPDPPDPHS